MRNPLLGLLFAVAAVGLMACDAEEQVAAPPTPQELTRDDIGHYCNMIVLDHKGPKGQVFVQGKEEPVWFTSVRDTIAFTLLPDEPKNLSAVYVTDVGQANWDAPEPGTWIDAREAWYVVGSDRVGGMGAPEAVPFGEQDEAQAFAKQHGGHVVAFADIPEDAILGQVEMAPGHGEHGNHNEHGSGHSTMQHDTMQHDKAQEAHDHGSHGHTDQ